MKKSFINKPLFKIEQRNNLITLLIFSLIIGVLCFVTIALFPVLEDLMAKLQQENVGTNLEQFLQMGSIADYFTANFYEIWGLLGGIYAAYLAVKLTSDNFKNNSYELIYTMNVSRGNIIRTKLLSLILNVTIFNVIVAAFTYVSLVVFAGISAFSTLNFLIYTLIMWLVCMQIGLVSFGLGLIAKHKFGTFASIVLVVILYILTTISITSNSVEWLGYLSPLTITASNIFSCGFTALKDSWIVLLAWTVLAPVITMFGYVKFKNDDLC